MLLPIYVVVGVINILANINDYNIPNTPEFKDLRVRRSTGELAPYATANKDQKTKTGIKTIFNGDYFIGRAKREYPNYPTKANPNPGYNSTWNNYAGSYPGYYNGNAAYTPGSNGYNAASGIYYNQAGYNSYTYRPYKPQGYINGYGYPTPPSAGYSAPPPNYTPTTPGYDGGAVKSTTPYIAKVCIMCNIGCPEFMRKIGLLCVRDDSDEE